METEVAEIVDCGGADRESGTSGESVDTGEIVGAVRLLEPGDPEGVAV